MFTFAFGYNLARAYNVNPIAGGIVSFAAVVTCMNQSAIFDFILPNVDSSAFETLKIQICVTIPNVYIAITPGIIAANALLTAGGTDSGSQGFFSVIIVLFLVQLLWFFGLHGSNVMAPIIEGVYDSYTPKN